MKSANRSVHAAYVVDFDDFCDNTFDATRRVVDKILTRSPDFKCTLFTIPARTSDSTITLMHDQYPMCALAPHGHYHTRGECLHWSPQLTTLRITEAISRGINAPIFKPPGWLMDEDVYEACNEMDVALATHNDLRIGHMKVRAGEYCYNNAGWRQRKTRAIHGHVSNVCDKYIEDMYERGLLTFPKYTEGKHAKNSKGGFLWCHEAVKVTP